MTVICGLDIASRTGVAFMRGDRLVLSGCLTSDDENDGAYFGRFQERLRVLLTQCQPKHAAIEALLVTNNMRRQVHHGDMLGTFTTESLATNFAVQHRLMGLQGCAKALLWQMGIPFFTVQSQAWRKAFLGIGRAPVSVPAKQRRKWWKQQAIAQCKLLKFDVKGDDEAEAIGICWWLGGMLKLRKFEGELFERENAA